MKTSTEITNITADFLVAQKEIKGAVKNATNPYFNSKYADLTAVIDACKKELNKNGIAVLQPIDGMSVETILVHFSGEWFSSLTPIVCKSQNDPQALGSAISYARRYGLQSMVLMPAEDDDGNNATDKESAKEADPTDAWTDQVKEVGVHYCNEHKTDMKPREDFHGDEYWDHRKKEGDTWFHCSGKGWIAQANSGKK